MAYGFTAKIDIDNTKVSGSSNLPNFHTLVKGTYDGTGSEPDIRTVANGGNIENTDATGGIDGATTVPADLAFYDDASGTTKYDHEIVKYNATTGEIVAWVEIPSLLYNSDTTLYMHYGDSGVTTSQENIAGMWADYHAVYHGATLKDSSPSGYDLTAQGSAGVNNSTAKIAGSFGALDGSSQYYDVDIAATITDPISMQGWMNSDADDNGAQNILYFGTSGDRYFRICLQTDWAGNPPLTQIYDGTASNTLSTSTGVTFGQWHMVHGSANASGHADIYIDGGGRQTATTNLTFSDNGEIMVGAWRRPVLQYFDGYLEELRIYNGQLSADWIATEYNSQNSPSTFYTMGDETAVGGGSGRTAVSSRTAAGARTNAGARDTASSRTAVS